MCGIVGFSGNDTEKLQSMMTSIAHRGPDDQGLYVNDSVSLGHVRLSIIDVSHAGHQPMQYQHLTIVFNGEIYNFNEIRSELSEYSFDSHSDTEVVLKAFHKWGVKAIDKFIGMFAFAIWDAENEKLFLFRDRIGVKPLYYYFDENTFAFASEPKAIKAYKPDLAINEKALFEFFQYGYISSGLSIYKHCFKVPPGHYLVYQNNLITLNEYWSIDRFFTLPKFQKSEAELINELEALLIDACRYRMVADVPVGVFLSGGIDSSVVAAILQKHLGNIHTFTIGFHENRYNEANYAKAVANYLGTYHTEKYLGINEAKTILERFVDIYDEPFGDSSGIPTTLVSQIAKEAGVKVVLSADGGDEVFCGYERYWLSYRIGRILFRCPAIVRKILGKTMDFIGVRRASMVLPLHNIEHKYSQLSQMLRERSWKGFYERIVHTFKEFEIGQLLGHKGEVREPSFVLGAKEHPMQGMMLWDYHRYLPDDILTKVDRATMSVSIEGREPLLDHRIAEFMAQVPFEYKYRNGTSKYLLRKVLERYIPKELIDRPKMGFGIPIFEWFQNDLKKLFADHMNEEQLNKHHLLNTRLVQSWLTKYYAGEPININKLWLILVFQMWYRKWMR